MVIFVVRALGYINLLSGTWQVCALCRGGRGGPGQKPKKLMDLRAGFQGGWIWTPPLDERDMELDIPVGCEELKCRNPLFPCRCYIQHNTSYNV